MPLVLKQHPGDFPKKFTTLRLQTLASPAHRGQNVTGGRGKSHWYLVRICSPQKTCGLDWGSCGLGWDSYLSPRRTLGFRILTFNNFSFCFYEIWRALSHWLQDISNASSWDQPQVQGRQRRAAVGLADAKSISERSCPEESLHETANFQIP